MIPKNCIWKKRGVCKEEQLDKECAKDCDMLTLKFDKDEIIKRMKQEEKTVQELKKKSLWKNKEEIVDKIQGINVLQKVLNEHFKHLEAHVVDPDLEKSSMSSMKGWRQPPRK